MVYCGKPSKGCSNCRERKIRCDQRDPGCGQCEKRQQECPGYRNIVDLMFRDESSHVIKKAKAKARRKAGATATEATLSPPETTPRSLSASRTPEPNVKELSILTPNSTGGDELQSKEFEDSNLLPSPDGPNWPATPMIALAYSLTPTFQECGTAYFFSQYVSVEENACHQRFDFVYDIWKPVSSVPDRQVDGVMASMTAVGLVSLSNMTRSEAMMEAARKSYGTALRLTNAALMKPTEAVKDSTLLSVLILGLYEMLAGRTVHTLRAWQEHINGAAALAKMRGMSQFTSKAGIKMFLMLCQSVMVSCIQREVPMPAALVTLRNQLGQRLNPGDPAWRICDPIYKLLQIRFDLKSSRLRSPEHMVARLSAIEDEFQALTLEFPREWDFRALRTERSHPAVWGDTCHVYPSMWHATVWNGVRAARIMVHETILDELRKGWQQQEEKAGEAAGQEEEEREREEDSKPVGGGWGLLKKDEDEWRGRVGVNALGMDLDDPQPSAYSPLPNARDSAGPLFDSPRWTEEYRRSTVVLERLREAVLASVPQHFGLVSNRRSRSSGGSLGHSGDTLTSIPTVEIRTPPRAGTGASPGGSRGGSHSSPHSPQSNRSSNAESPPPSTGSASGSSRPDLLNAAPPPVPWQYQQHQPQQRHHQSRPRVHHPHQNPPTSPTGSTSSLSSSESSSASRNGNTARRRGKRTATASSRAASVVARETRGPTILDPTRARTPEEEAERFMLLASASNMIVFPLYLVGMGCVSSSAALAAAADANHTPNDPTDHHHHHHHHHQLFHDRLLEDRRRAESMHAYALDRLRGIWRECSLPQAEAVADIVEESGLAAAAALAAAEAEAEDGQGEEDAEGEDEDDAVGGGQERPTKDEARGDAMFHAFEAGVGSGEGTAPAAPTGVGLGSRRLRDVVASMMMGLDGKGDNSGRWVVGGRDYSTMVV